MQRAWVRTAAFALVSIASGFWIWFGIASAWGERLGIGNWLVHLMLPGGVLAASLLVALRSKSVGGGLLVLEGLIVGVAYPWMTWGRFPVSTIAMVLTTLAFPPFLSGVLFLVDARRSGGIAPVQ